MSLSTLHSRGFKLIREVIRPLPAWDAMAGSAVTLEPGTILSSCHIVPNCTIGIDAVFEAYVMEFDAVGRRLQCPLYRFQPKTRTTAGG